MKVARLILPAKLLQVPRGSERVQISADAPYYVLSKDESWG